MVLISMFGMFAMRQMSWKRYTSRLSHNRHTHTHFITTNPRVCAHAHCTLFERRSVRAHFRIIFFFAFAFVLLRFLSFSLFFRLLESLSVYGSITHSFGLNLFFICFWFFSRFFLPFCLSFSISLSFALLLSFTPALAMT